jgi:hypothetical protein
MREALEPVMIPEVHVTVAIDKHQLMAALRIMTLTSGNFNPGWWAISDAETLEEIAKFIRSQIRSREKGERHL